MRAIITAIVTSMLIAAPVAAQQQDSLATYRTTLHTAFTLQKGESLKRVADRLKKLAAPAEYKAMQKQVADEAKAAGRLQEQAAQQEIPSDCAAPAGGSGTSTCRMPLSKLNNRALEAGRQFPIAYKRYTAARDTLLAQLDRQLAPPVPLGSH